jgi:hypothetical protein
VQERSRTLEEINSLMRTLTLLTLLLPVVLVTEIIQAKEPAKKSRPNVILILSDDMGYSDLPKFVDADTIHTARSATNPQQRDLLPQNPKRYLPSWLFGK